MRHYTIPIFIPEIACPNRCKFCNQQKISGTFRQPGMDEVIAIIERNLSTIPAGSEVEIGFFGGNFTGIDPELQRAYLEHTRKFTEEGSVHGIRLSTRPDYIDHDRLKMLKSYPVKTIELGAQSLDEEVLKLSGRGHTVEDVIRASAMIREYGFELGLQMMIGLPGDSLEKSLATADQIIELGASCTRVYPTLVIRDTELEDHYRKGLYTPLSLEEAVSWTKEIVRKFEKVPVKVLRIGLHPSEGLLTGENLIAGPFDVSFGEMVTSALWLEDLQNWLQAKSIEHLIEETSRKGKLLMEVAPRQINAAIGRNASNRKMLQEYFVEVKFTANPGLNGREFRAVIS